jgi:hypothetical protein
VSEAFLSYHLLFAIGINNVINFVFHVFLGDIAAKFIGWENSPFQAEVGFASLGVGIAGVIAFKASLPFRFATLIPPWAFSLGAAGGHIYQMIVAHNFSPGNVGLVLPIDILMPIVGFVFLWLSYKHPHPGTAYRKLTYRSLCVHAACPAATIASNVNHEAPHLIGLFVIGRVDFSSSR